MTSRIEPEAIHQLHHAVPRLQFPCHLLQGPTFEWLQVKSAGCCSENAMWRRVWVGDSLLVLIF